MLKDNHKSLAYKLLIIMLLCAPLLWGLSRPVTILVIELLSLPLIWVVIQHRKSLLDQYVDLVWMAFVLIGLFLLQLLPVPLSIWEGLSGREVFSEVFNYLPDDYSTRWRAVSVVPESTEKALLYLLPAIAVFFTVLLLDKTSIIRLVWLAFFIAIFQSILGLIQYGGGIQLVENILYTGSARGTYLNRDHLAGFLVMVYPVVLAMLASMLGYRSKYTSSRRKRWQYIATLEGNQSLVYAIIAMLIILCLIFTRSRSGIALVMIGMLISLFAFSFRLGRNNNYGVYGSVIAIIVILAIEIGLAPVLDRFSVDPMQDLRWEIYSITMRIIGDYFPLGSGMGTFSSIYAGYQPPNSDGFINQAHNDYLQWVLEGGLLMMLLIGFGLYRYFSHWRTVWLSGQWDGFRYIQVGAGIGVFLVLLHSMLDFGLHKPANNIYFAFFMAIFLKSGMQKKQKAASVADRR